MSDKEGDEKSPPLLRNRFNQNESSTESTTPLQRPMITRRIPERPSFLRRQFNTVYGFFAEVFMFFYLFFMTLVNPSGEIAQQSNIDNRRRRDGFGDGRSGRKMNFPMPGCSTSS